MKYQGQPDYGHDGQATTGILLVNLGTPDAPEPGAVRRYLAEFLSDPRVVEVPRAIWLPILYGAILPFRSRRSAHAYASIWTERGSPLLSLSQDLATALQAELDARGHRTQVRLAMRYGNPSLRSVLDDWRRQGLRRLLVLPLYPQYSATTTASVFDAVNAAIADWRWMPELRWINDYYQQPDWLDSIAASVRRHWQAHGRGDRLLLSFHGLPQRYLRAGDPYFCQCHASARRIAERLALAEGEWQLSFQSRVGREPWLQPYTDQTLRELAGQGVRTIDLVCPGFAVDCLETLEEIAIQNAEAFVAAGGSALRYVPALNAGEDHARVLAGLVEQHGGGWPGLDSRLAPGDAGEQKRQFLAYRGPQR